MKTKDVLTLCLAVAGTFLVWFPVLFPVILTIIHFAETQQFLFDFLMPAELFPMILIGGILLLWAAMRAKQRRGFLSTSFGVAIALPILGSLLATVTGLASGDTPEGGWESALVTAIFIAYFLAVIVLGVGGILLISDLFKPIKNPI
jgi:hypothetical protein